ncbi:MAG: ABC transporter permease [Holophagales bacterium]|nr:ABC transporter permease [Holophagales bacterium]
MFHDLRFALRLARQRPFLTLVAVLCLGLGIGVNVTIFAWMRSTVLNPVPGVPDSGSLVCVDGRDSRGPGSIDTEDYVALRRDADVFESSCGFDMLPLGLRVNERAESAWTQVVTGDFFGTFRLRPALGRLLSPSDGRTGQPLVAVLSHAYWERRFASDPGVVGRSVLLQGKPCTIVGVAPAGFHGAMSGIRMDAFVPLEPYIEVTKNNRASRTPNGGNDVFARLKPGVGLKQASDRIQSLSRALARQRTDRDESWEAFVLPITSNRHGMQSVLRVPMFVLFVAAAFLFLVACSNVASLLLARGAERKGEFAIRMALGGSRGRLLLQILLEGLPLGVAGGLLGVLAAWASQRLLLGFLPVTHYPVLLEPRLDGGALLFGALLSLLTALLVSLLPALFSSNVQLGPAMKEGGPKGSLGVGHRRLMSTLLVGELALATLLLAVTGQVVRTMIALRGSPTGFELRNQLVVGLDFGASDLPPAQRPRLVGDLLLRARELPGVESAAVGFRVPLDFGGFWSSEVEPEGHTFEKGESPKADWNVVSPGYFQTLGVPLLSGREFDERDVSGSETVAIVDDRFVKRFWPGQSGVGRRVRLGDGSTVVVGVVRAITYEPFGSDRGFTLYQPFAQVPMSSAVLHVRGKNSPAALVAPLRAVLSELAPTLPMGYVRDLASFQRGARFPLVILAQVLGFLGGVTLFLAAVGIYGLFAHSTARRSREFGIRLSMGATPGNLYRLVLGQGARLALLALVLGLLGAVALGQLLKTVLAEIDAADPWVLGGVTLVLASVTFVALLVPARRAALLEPSVALRED